VQPSVGTKAITSPQETLQEGSALSSNLPEGEHWRNIKKWVVFSDLHVDLKTAEVRVV